MNKQTINVTIFDEHYSLISDELEAHLIQAANLVDEQMCAISKSGIKDHYKIGVLVALQLASKYLKEKALLNHNNIEKEIILQRLDLQNKLLSELL